MKRDVQTLRLHVSFWWAMQDSNLRQLGYEPRVLTAELMALMKLPKQAVANRP